MTTKHTPGPWCYTDNFGIVKFDSLGQLAVRIAEPACRTTHEGEANARLISAAPELLEALKAVVHECCTPEPEHYGRSHQQQMADRMAAFDRARAAIAKAEGRQA